MKITVLNGSPRLNGDTAKMIKQFKETAEGCGHEVGIFDVCHMNIKGCLACEYCHERNKGVCIQKDDMEKIYEALKKTEMLILASPIYYHNLSGQLKCVIDRFYSILYPEAPECLKKTAMFLSSGDPQMYDGARFSYEGDFLGYLSLQDCGIFTNHDEDVYKKIEAMAKEL